MGYGWGWIFMFLFWGLVILGIVYLVKMLTTGPGRSEQQETAEEILRKRYARGELNREEFEKSMEVLKQHE